MSLGDLYERRGAWPRGANTLFHNGFAIAGLAMLSTALVTSAVSAPLPTQSREFGSSIILKVGERGSAAAAGAIMGGACLAPLSRDRLLRQSSTLPRQRWWRRSSPPTK
jgi:hypothetical protein